MQFQLSGITGLAGGSSTANRTERADDSDSKSAKGASKDGAIRDHNRLSNASSQSDESDHPQKLDLKDRIMQGYQGAPQFSEE